MIRNRSVIPTMGRPPVLSLALSKKLVEEGRRRALTDNSIYKGDVGPVVVELLKTQATNNNENPEAVKGPSASTIRRIQQELLPDARRLAPAQTRRRTDVKNDPFTYIANAAVYAAAVSGSKSGSAQCDSGGVNKHFVFNTDDVGFLLESQYGKVTVVLPTGVGDEMKQRLQMVKAKTKGGDNSANHHARTVHVKATASQAGSLLTAIVIIKDRNIETPQLRQLDDTIWLLTRPVKCDEVTLQAAMYEHVILPAMVAKRSALAKISGRLDRIDINLEGTPLQRSGEDEDKEMEAEKEKEEAPKGQEEEHPATDDQTEEDVEDEDYEPQNDDENTREAEEE